MLFAAIGVINCEKSPLLTTGLASLSMSVLIRRRWNMAIVVYLTIGLVFLVFAALAVAGLQSHR